MKKGLFAALVMGVLIFTWTAVVYADATTTTQETQTPLGNAPCGITAGDLSAIAAIQNNASLDYLSELEQELAARKSLLEKTISCAEADAKQAQAALNNVPVDQGFQELKNQWSDRLGGAVSYYDLQLQKIGGAGISGTESIAKEVLSWRDVNYVPLTENVSNFITWSNNQSLFVAAARRLAQVDNLVGSPLFSENIDLQNDYEQAAVSLKTANDQNDEARNALSQSLPPDRSLSLIEGSLDSLSSVYQHFFDISGLVQSLLPH